MTCYIVGAGEFYGFLSRPTAQDVVIAADGGYAVCLREGVTPNYVLGDFDSLGHVPAASNVEVVPVEKDDTDMMLAVKKGLALGCREFYLYGGTGGRADHTMANLQTLLYLKNRGASGWLVDVSCRCTVLKNESVTFPAQESGILSVFAFGGVAKGVSVTGAKYSLEDGTLNPEFPLGVSNHFVGEAVTVSVTEGALLVYLSQNDEGAI